MSAGRPDVPRVLMVGPDVGAIGGMGSVATTLARAAARRGRYQVRLLDSGGGTGPRGWLHWPGALVGAARADAELFHLHVASQGSTWRKASFAAVARTRRIPYVVHLHGAGYVDFLAGLPAGRHRVVEAFFQGAARVVTLGTPWRRLVLRELHTDPARTVVVANGVDEVVRRPATRTIVHLGELSRRKGVDVLLDAAEQVLPRHPDWRLLLVGPTPEQDLVDRAQALAHRLDGRVEVTGPRFGQAKDATLAEAGVFVLASRHEGLPMAMLEAMSAGVPVVVTPVGAIGEVVTDDENGLLVPPGDAGALTAALEALVEDPAARGRLGGAGHATWQQRYSGEAMASAVEHEWDLALGRGVDRAAPTARASSDAAAGSGHPDTVTVIIPTIGRDSLVRAVASVCDQATERLDVRVVVVNDSGAPLAHDLGDQVRVVDTPGRLGVSAARNLGLATVDTDWFSLLDDDDEQHPGHLAAAIETLRARDADVYFCRGLVRRGPGRSRVEPAELPAGGATLREYLLGLSNWRSRSRRVLTSTVVVRAQWSGHRFDEAMRVSEDTWYLLGLEAAGARVVAGPGVHVTMDADDARDQDRRAAQRDPRQLEHRLERLDPAIMPGYLVGRYGRAAARAGDPAGVLRVAAQAVRAGGRIDLAVPVLVELGASLAMAGARLARR